MIIADTPETIGRYQLIVVRQGLKACQIGLRLNRAYTPKNLMRIASQATGKKFGARDYQGAIDALTELLA